MMGRPDNRLADAPMVPVMCRRCGAGVAVRKSSWNQTSVQWSAAALGRCEERCGPGVFFACTALTDSITDAVRRGELPVLDVSVT